MQFRRARARARPRELTEAGGDAAGRGGEPGLGALPARGRAARPCLRPAGPAEPGLAGPSCLDQRPNQRAPPTRPALSPSGDRKSAQQMRKWQAGWPWGLLSSPAPSQPSTTARLAPTGESGPPRAGSPRAQAPDPRGHQAWPGLALPRQWARLCLWRVGGRSQLSGAGPPQ